MAGTVSGFCLSNDAVVGVRMHVLYTIGNEDHDDVISGIILLGQSTTELLGEYEIPPSTPVRLKVTMGGVGITAAESFPYDPKGPIQGYKISGTTLTISFQYTGPK